MKTYEVKLKLMPKPLKIEAMGFYHYGGDTNHYEFYTRRYETQIFVTGFLWWRKVRKETVSVDYTEIASIPFHNVEYVRLTEETK